MSTNDKKNKRDPREVVRAIDAIAEDVLDPAYPIEDVDAELRAEGIDPEAVGRRGAALAAELLAKARAKLREETVRRAAPLEQRLGRVEARRPSRDEMRARIERAEADPRYAGRIAVAARGRRPEEPTDAEIAALYDALVALGVIAVVDDDGSDGEGGAKA